jgi:predicted XRE-type DNA-binding protein
MTSTGRKLEPGPIAEGAARYERWRDTLLDDPAFRAVYEEEATKNDLWLQLVEARQAAGLSQAELAERLGIPPARVARIEQRGYDAYTLNTLRRYVQALGEGFTLEVRIHRPEMRRALTAPVAS